MKVRGWLQRIFDALNNITKTDYENCDKLKALTGHDWEPWTHRYNISDADLKDNYYLCRLPSLAASKALQTVLQKYITDSELGDFKNAEKSEFKKPNEQIGQCSPTCLLIAPDQFKRLVVMPHYSKDKFNTDLAAQTLKYQEEEKALGTKLQDLEV